MCNLKDEHVKKLVARCNKITELNLGGQKTLITKQSLNLIIEHLQSTLVTLNLECTHVRFESRDLFKLKSMEKLTQLCYDYERRNYVDHGWLKKQLPNLWIYPNPFHPLYSNPRSKTIASPRHPPDFNQHQGLWEIKAERQDLFGWRTLALSG